MGSTTTTNGGDPTRVTGADRTRPVLLLVDDDDDSREMYAAYLGRRGFEVVEAADGRTAIERSISAAPDLAIMDLTLPDMDGLRAIHEIRQDERTAALPVIVVSGHGPERSTTAPWDAYLSKPCAPDELVAEIKKLLASSGHGT
ncbi:response regulator [Myxococcota bacterium]|nr:response regulator [Myxococcota bacterium]